jgi:O-antigen ligase
MTTRPQTSSAAPIALIAFLLLLAAGGGLLIAKTGPGLSLGVTLLLVVLFASFLNTELALHIILLSMLLSPEIVVGGVGGVSIGKPVVKGDLLVLRIEDLILGVVALAWIAKVAIFKDLGLVRKTPLNSPIFTYVAVLIVATLFGVLFGNVKPIRGFFFILKYIEYFVVFFMTVNSVWDERQFRRLLATALATCAISSLIGILQISSGERVSAPFEGQYGEPNTFGGYLVLMLAIILGLALAAETIPRQIIWYTFAGFIIVPLLFTLSRTSWLATIPMLLALIVLSPRRMIIIGGIVLALAFGSSFTPKSVVDRYNYTLNAKEDRGDYEIGGAKVDTSTSARLESWGLGFTAWTKRPFFGYGVAGFGFIDAQYIRVLVEGGLFAIASFLWLLWRILRLGWNAHRLCFNTKYGGLATGYLAGAIAMMVHSIGANTFIIVRIMEPFWFLTGIITLLPALVVGKPVPQSAPLANSAVGAGPRRGIAAIPR